MRYEDGVHAAADMRMSGRLETDLVAAKAQRRAPSTHPPVPREQRVNQSRRELFHEFESRSLVPPNSPKLFCICR